MSAATTTLFKFIPDGEEELADMGNQPKDEYVREDSFDDINGRNSTLHVPFTDTVFMERKYVNPRALATVVEEHNSQIELVLMTPTETNQDTQCSPIPTSIDCVSFNLRKNAYRHMCLQHDDNKTSVFLAKSKFESKVCNAYLERMLVKVRTHSKGVDFSVYLKIICPLPHYYNSTI